MRTVVLPDRMANDWADTGSSRQLFETIGILQLEGLRGCQVQLDPLLLNGLKTWNNNKMKVWLPELTICRPPLLFLDVGA